MRFALFPLLLLGFVAVASAASEQPLPGRDGNYEFGESIEGTVWEGVFWPPDNVVIRFEPRGVLWYKYPGGVSRAGTWKQDGPNLYIETNKKYAEYHAVIRGNRIIGNAHNITKLKWNWEVQRRPASFATQAEGMPLNLKDLPK